MCFYKSQVRWARLVADEIESREKTINTHSKLNDFCFSILSMLNSHNFCLLNIWLGADIEIISCFLLRIHCF